MSGPWPWLRAALVRGERCVLVTVADSRGSTPRELGAHMVVSDVGGGLGTIGGGRLEHAAEGIARALLASGAPGTEVRRFPLGPSLGQCCGGVATLAFDLLAGAPPAWLEAAAAGADPAVLATSAGPPVGGGKMLVTGRATLGTLGAAALDGEVVAAARRLLAGGTPVAVGLSRGACSAPVLLEPVGAAATRVVVFGAGHVGTALVAVLQVTGWETTWVDARADRFPVTVPENVTVEVTGAPLEVVERAAPGTHYVIMTHSHPLDQMLCEAVLRRGDQGYCGLIGSLTKRRRFEQRLRARDLSDAALARLTCPIGVPGIRDKHPGHIAVAVAAELLLIAGQASAACPSPPPPVRSSPAP